MRQHYERNVKPWLTQRAPWALRDASMIQGVYDSSMPDDESDSDRNPLDVIQEMVGGYWEPGPVSWEARKGPLITAINRHMGPGKLALQIDPVDGWPLVQSLSGRWYYPQDRLGGVSRDLPKKPNHPWEDLGDAFVNFLCVAMPEVTRLKPRDQGRIETRYDPRFIDDLRVDQEFDTRIS